MALSLHCFNRSVVSFAAATVIFAGPQPPPAFRSDADLVICHARVLDKTNRPVLDLDKGAFTVYEDGKPQEIRVFAHEDVPVSLGLVIDNSAGMADKRARVAAAGLAIVETLNPRDETFVVNFNEQAYLDLPDNEAFTHDPAEVKQALGRRDARGNSCVRDAVAKALAFLDHKANNPKKVLIVVTNGRDTGSSFTERELLQAVEQSDTLVYVIGLINSSNCGEQLAATRRALHQLAEVTGAEAFFPKTADQVDSIARQIARAIRDQYVIGFRPTDQAATEGFHSIRIAVTARERMVVQTRTGYYRPKPPADRYGKPAGSRAQLQPALAALRVSWRDFSVAN